MRASAVVHSARQALCRISWGLCVESFSSALARGLIRSASYMSCVVICSISCMPVVCGHDRHLSRVSSSQAMYRSPRYSALVSLDSSRHSLRRRACFVLVYLPNIWPKSSPSISVTAFRMTGLVVTRYSMYSYMGLTVPGSYTSCGTSRVRNLCHASQTRPAGGAVFWLLALGL